jgi:hypothetical protein
MAEVMIFLFVLNAITGVCVFALERKVQRLQKEIAALKRRTAVPAARKKGRARSSVKSRILRELDKII